MKKIATLSAVLFLFRFSTLFAGEPIESSKAVVAPQAPPPPESLYRNHEWQVDLFGTYATEFGGNTNAVPDHAWGGGAAINYFFTRHLGLGIEGQAMHLAFTDETAGLVAANLYYRFPIGATPLAPYVYAGTGAFFNATNINSPARFFNRVGDVATDLTRRARTREQDTSTRYEGHFGLGVEYRFVKWAGIFSDARYEWLEGGSNDFFLFRTGLRLAF
jgi:hypothetical protein